jgi:hypothetical protein
MISALGEEIWARDLTDAAWNLFRWPGIKAAAWRAKAWRIGWAIFSVMVDRGFS